MFTLCVVRVGEDSIPREKSGSSSLPSRPFLNVRGREERALCYKLGYLRFLLMLKRTNDVYYLFLESFPAPVRRIFNTLTRNVFEWNTPGWHKRWKNEIVKSLNRSCLIGSIIVRLRTVPTIVTAHTFCASRDTRVSYGWCLLIQG